MVGYFHILKLKFVTIHSSNEKTSRHLIFFIFEFEVQNPVAKASPSYGKNHHSRGSRRKIGKEFGISS